MGRSKFRVTVSWFFIIIAILGIQFKIYDRRSDSSSLDSAAGLQVQMTGKIFIGVRRIGGQNPLLKERLSQMEQAFHISQGKSDQLADIPLIAEIYGRDAALQELERMATNRQMAEDDDFSMFYRLYKDGSDSLDSKQRNTLKGYGWVGRLALSQDKPDSDPERKAVLRSASLMVYLLGLMNIAVVAALVAGLILLVIAIVQAVKGNLKSHLAMPEKPGGLLLETFAIYLVLSATGLRYGGILISVFAGLLPILWPLFQGAKWKEYCIALGWHRGKGVFREIGAGITGYIAGLPLMAAALVLVVLLMKYTGVTGTHPIVFEVTHSPIFIFLLVTLYAPFTEETLFRGALYGYLRRSCPWVVSGIISSLIFAILHPQGWVAVPALGVIGFNLSAIREWRGSAIASMTAHALNNGSIFLVLIIFLA